MWFTASIGLAPNFGLRHIATLACIGVFVVLTALHALEVKLKLKVDLQKDSDF